MILVFDFLCANYCGRYNLATGLARTFLYCWDCPYAQLATALHLLVASSTSNRIVFMHAWAPIVRSVAFLHETDHKRNWTAFLISTEQILFCVTKRCCKSDLQQLEILFSEWKIHKFILPGVYYWIWNWLN